MNFLRRLVGGGDDRPAETDAADDPAELEAWEREQTASLLRAEQERLDELRQRQLRYAKYAWRPPAQGGTRRADDGEDDAAAD
jgi:hypothetical protein